MDFRFAADDLKLAIPALRNGLYYPIRALDRLRLLIGRTAMSRLLLEGAPMDAATLLRWGMLDEVRPSSQLEEHTLAFAARLAAQPLDMVRDFRAMFDALDRGDRESAAAIRAAGLERRKTR
jgi:enoyl-CoA hydratase/carnithine racemase